MFYAHNWWDHWYKISNRKNGIDTQEVVMSEIGDSGLMSGFDDMKMWKSEINWMVVVFRVWPKHHQGSTIRQQ